MPEPNIDDFQKWLAKKEEVKLTPFQTKLIASYIDFRKTVYSGGMRSGRTTALRLIKQYFNEKFPYSTDEEL